FNTVMRCEKSSLSVWAELYQKNETLLMHGMDDKKYALCGGGFPVRIKTGEIVGVITVSNLSHIEDHEILVRCLANYLGISNFPTIEYRTDDM
ncbi:MAG: heme-binding protein, partial [Oribacterium sp.]|nr:heme-binding protein [Oribacterium sp.]